MILVRMDARPPALVKAELGQNGGVVLSWKPRRLAEEFVITRFRQGLIFWYEEETFTIPATGLHEYSYTDSKGLQEGETYRYKLVARNSDSGNSGEITTEVKIPVPMVTLTLKVEPVGGGKINGHSSGSYPKGSVIELVAVPNENYEFDYWEWNGTKEYGEVFKRTINENSILIAVFKLKEEPEPPEDPPEDPGNGDTPGAAGFPWSRGAWALLYRYSFPFPWLFRLARLLPFMKNRGCLLRQPLSSSFPYPPLPGGGQKQPALPGAPSALRGGRFSRHPSTSRAGRQPPAPSEAARNLPADTGGGATLRARKKGPAGVGGLVRPQLLQSALPTPLQGRHFRETRPGTLPRSGR